MRAARREDHPVPGDLARVGRGYCVTLYVASEPRADPLRRKTGNHGAGTRLLTLARTAPEGGYPEGWDSLLMLAPDGTRGWTHVQPDAAQRLAVLISTCRAGAGRNRTGA